jgi:hypothetical protein
MAVVEQARELQAAIRSGQVSEAERLARILAHLKAPVVVNVEDNISVNEDISVNEVVPTVRYEQT